MVAQLLELLSSSTFCRMGMLSLIPGTFFGTQEEGCTLEVLQEKPPGREGTWEHWNYPVGGIAGGRNRGKGKDGSNLP